VFSGDPPYQPGGCIAQAWSVAELLRAVAEELGQQGVSMRSEKSAAVNA
jgi:glycogen debranching enzyme